MMHAGKLPKGTWKRTNRAQSEHGATGVEARCSTLKELVLHVWVPLGVLLAVHVPRAHSVLKVLQTNLTLS